MYPSGMRSHRLDRLARLTQGAALVGLGVFAAGCNNEPKHTNAPDPNATGEPIHINATATPQPSASVTAPTAVDTTAPPTPSASAPPATSGSAKPPSLTPHINAPPNRPPHTNG